MLLSLSRALRPIQTSARLAPRYLWTQIFVANEEPEGEADKVKAKAAAKANAAKANANAAPDRSLAPLDPETAGDAYWRTPLGVDTYLATRLSSPEYAGARGLARGAARAAEAGVQPGVSPMFGQFLAVLARAVRAERVLVIGARGGYAASFLANALPPRGQIDAIVADAAGAKVAQRAFLDMDLYPFPTTHVGDALALLRDPSGPFARPPGAGEGFPAEECGYDVVFVDGERQEYFGYFEEGMRLAKKGGVIVLNDVLDHGRVAMPADAEGANDPETVAVRKIFDWIEKDAGKSVLATAMQTVGARPWDGYAIIYKK